MSPGHEEFVKHFYEAREVGKKLDIILQTSAITHAKRLVTAYCGAIATPSFIVNPNGTITCCERDADGEKFGYGSFDLNSKSFVIDAKRMSQNKKYLNIPSECNDCFCKYHCAGDCPDLKKEGQTRCELNRLFLKRELEEILS